MKFKLSFQKHIPKIILLLGLYSVLWLVCAVCIYGIFYTNGKLFLWVDDSVYQHFVSFDYLCQYLRSLLIDHRPLGFFNFTVGQGADILTTLTAYGFTDPVNILAAMLFPLSRLMRYTLSIFIKLYLIGLSFIVFCWVSEKKDLPAVLAGAIAYTFSGVILFTFARHPIHINWAYYFPLLLTGVELYNRRNRKLPLILFVFLNLITSYYTFYMNAVLTVLYIVICSLCRIYLEVPNSSWKQEMKNDLSLAAIFAVGILLASFILFPIIHAYMNNARVMETTGYTDSLWHFEWAYYSDLIEAFFEPFFDPGYGYYTYIGMGTVVFIPLALLFIKKGHSRLKALLIVSLIMLCLPIVGQIMNGMSYVSNRWCYAAVFYGTFALAELYDELKDLSLSEKCRILIITATYILIILFFLKTFNKSNAVFTLLMLSWTVLVFVLSQFYKKTAIGETLVCLALVGSLFQIYFTFSKSTAFYTSQFLDYKKMPSCYTDCSSTAAAELDNGFYRIEEKDVKPNRTGINKLNSTSTYWSLLPSGYLDYYNGLNLNTLKASTVFHGLDARTGLLDLASIKYYTRPATETELVPYGFEEVDSPDGNYQVFENKNALPIGYTYDRIISRSEYEALNGLEKEQALMQAAVLEEELPEFETADLRTELIDLDYQIVETNGVTWSDHHLDAGKGGIISFSADVPEGYEIYMVLQGIRITSGQETVRVDAGRTKENYSVRKRTLILSPKYNWYFERDAVAFNLGFGHAGKNDFSLTVDSAASFDLEDLRIVAVPMSLYQRYAQDRAEYVLEDIVMGEDSVVGSISVPDKRILQFSIPYSSGWKAYVDGKETTVMKSDVLYMAIPIDAGDHSIVLKYSTPYLKTGCTVSALTLISLCTFEILSRKKYRKPRREQ